MSNDVMKAALVQMLAVFDRGADSDHSPAIVAARAAIKRQEPAYPPDDGPLTDEQVQSIRRVVEQPKDAERGASEQSCQECEGAGWTTQPDPRTHEPCQVQCEPCLGTGAKQAEQRQENRGPLDDDTWAGDDMMGASS